MCKILTFPRNGFAAVKTAVRSAKLFAIGASLAGAICMASEGHAQSLAEYIAPTATGLGQNTDAARANTRSSVLSHPNSTVAFAGGSPQAGPVTTAMARELQGVPTVDASYSLLNDATQVVPAQGAAFIPGPAPGSNPCDVGCDVSWYIGAEAMFLKRESDNNFSLSRNVFMPTWDYEPGARITVGRLFDCTNGIEFIYAGGFEWDRGVTLNSPGGNLQSTFFPFLGYGPAEVSAFNDAQLHVQSYTAELDSLEINRRWWVWDVIATAVGIRYLEYDEDYAFYSQSGAEIGVYRAQAKNQLLGPQLCADLIYPVALRGNVGFKFKAGIFANFGESRESLENAGTLVLNAGADRTDWAGIIEYGVFGNYSIVPSIRLTAGYEFWWLPGMATVPEQSPQIVFPGSGTSLGNEDNVYFHGASFGAEILF